jgi:hypothetical protein
VKKMSDNKGLLQESSVHSEDINVEERHSDFMGRKSSSVSIYMLFRMILNL